MTDELRSLADPEKFHEPLDITGCDVRLLRTQLRLMLLIRKAEERIADMVSAGIIKCPCHLAIGQEAIPVSLSNLLRPTDRVFGAHRSHGHFLALNQDLVGLFAETLGKITGCSKGMGGSMHLIDLQNGFNGSVPIVGATVPIAVGAALSAKMDGRGDVAVGYFGDGAIEEGAVQESLNLAASLKLPTIFICENNFFSSHLHIGLRQPSESTARFARAHGIPFEVVDGNDVVTCNAVAKKGIEMARKGNGPFFLEAVTYRWRGHVGPSEDEDVGVKRKDDLHIWKRRDPIKRLRLALQETDLFSEEDFHKMESELNVAVEDAWQNAEDAPFPDNNRLLDTVFYGGKNS